MTIVPKLPRGVRLHDDRVRGTMFLLGPERAIVLDAIGAAILAELDGLRSIDAITDTLAARYASPHDEIAGDVREFLDELQAQRLLDYVGPVPESCAVHG